MPFKVKDLDKFHDQNPNISVSVFILTNQSDLKSILLLKPYKGNLRQYHIDLLLINNKKNSHYILIKDINTLLSKQRNKRYLC